jgi:beta-phosphoglucomutase
MRIELENETGTTPQTLSQTLIKAAIFDLDGVIVDTAHYHYMAWKKLAAQLGIDLTIEDNERLKGVSRMRSLDIILEIGGVSLPQDEKERLATRKNEWFLDYVEQMTPSEIFPGVKELIGILRSKGVLIGLASSSKNAPRVLELLQINELFDVVVDGTMIKHSKPDPEIFLLAASLLKLAPAECLVFEDAEAGVEAAVKAGMRCVGVGDPAQLGLANLVIKTTGQFTLADLEKLQ